MPNIPAYDDFMSTVRGRHSCRMYTPEPVSHEQMLEILEAARLAPSATNRQPWTFVVCESEESRAKVREAYDRPWIAPVPSFIVACGHHNEAWHRADGKDSTDIDLAIAIEHICLAATSLGLGSCWICNFDEKKLRASFDLPEGTEPIAIIPIGHPHPDFVPADRPRKSITEIVRWNSL